MNPNPNTVPQYESPKPPVIVKKVVKVQKKKPSLIEFLVGTIAVLLIFLLVGSFLAFSGWLYTYKALTKETVVAELYISKKVIKDGVPTAKVRYVQLNEEPALSFLGSKEIENEEIQLEMKGDQVFVDANFIRWQNWMSLLGIDPVYKVYRVKSDFRNISDREKYRSSAFELNGGSDKFVEDFAQNQSIFDWAVQSAFVSSAGQNVTDQDQVFNVVVTKDAIVLEVKK